MAEDAVSIVFIISSCLGYACIIPLVSSNISRWNTISRFRLLIDRASSIDLIVRSKASASLIQSIINKPDSESKGFSFSNTFVFAKLLNELCLIGIKEKIGNQMEIYSLYPWRWRWFVEKFAFRTGQILYSAYIWWWLYLGAITGFGKNRQI